MVRRHRSSTTPAASSTCEACASFGQEDAMTPEGIVRCARAEPCRGRGGGGAHINWCVIPRTQIPPGQRSSPDKDERDSGSCAFRRLTSPLARDVLGGFGTTSLSPARDSGQPLELLELGAADADSPECFDVRVVGGLVVTHLCSGTGRGNEKRCVVVGVRQGYPDSAAVSISTTSLSDALGAVSGGAAAAKAAVKARFAFDWSVLCGGGRGCQVAVSYCGLEETRPIIEAARSCWLQSQNVSREAQRPVTSSGSSSVKKNKFLHALHALTNWASGTRGRSSESVEAAQNRMSSTPPPQARDGVPGLRRAQTSSSRATRSLSLGSAVHLTLDRECKKERSSLSVSSSGWAPLASSNEPLWSFDEADAPDKLNEGLSPPGGARKLLKGCMDMDVHKPVMSPGNEHALGSTSDGEDEISREHELHDRQRSITRTDSEGPEDSSMPRLESFPFAITQSPVDFSSMLEGDASLESSWLLLEER